PRGREPAVQLRVTRNNFKKQLFIFYEYCTCDSELARKHRLFGRRDCDKTFITVFFSNSI
ncbi:hypothetical protein CVT45_05755, partial [Enterococcus faecium Com15]